ncbi:MULTISPECIES: FAD-dependent oxidoreductase [Streptomyces]|uniref:FAD-dependent oxidoreductase n=1 Tax=Streptomyces TaxID=1883 RepID=UPI000F73B723|nr:MULTISPECIES: FAD-binding protein [Streptomyces]MCM3263340.1 FAD-binding protein [Streptomyces thermoviolaceus]RSR98970.1 FAD-binding protein [Streptomyces sp. WAC00469]
MSTIDRRRLFTGAGAATVGAALTTAVPATRASAAAPAPHPAGDTIRPGDPRYEMLTTGNNKRFVAAPDYVRMIRSTEDAEQAVREAVRSGRRVSVRSGGHTFADLVCNPDVDVILDLSEMTEVRYDASRRAFAVQPGVRLLTLYEALYKGWGVTIPGGMCYSVGAGGHVAGGGYGLLSRAHGLVVDHLYAVEVVVVDRDRTVRTVVATREPDDPHRDLWWAHTGGGGGTFGLVTRYWFRSPDATGDTPSRQLMRPPSTVLVSALSFPWQDLDERRFSRLLKNFGAWHEQHSAPDAPETAIGTVFNVCHRAHGTLDLFVQADAEAPGADRMLDDYLTALTAGTGLRTTAMTRASGDLPAMPQLAAPRRMPWLDATRLVGTSNPTITHPALRGAHKSAYMRRTFTDRHTAVLYRHLTSEEYANPDTMVVLFSFGGRVNAVRPEDTAASQRASVFKMLFQTFWPDPSGDAAGLGWARAVYEDFLADTHGVPVPGEQYEGCYINYPDTDLKDPARNRSGVPWQTLYYQGNHDRLRRIKRDWDPTGFFHHSLSVDPA